MGHIVLLVKVRINTHAGGSGSQASFATCLCSPTPSPFTPRVALSLAALSLLLLRRANQVQSRLHIIMSGGRVSCREAKTALNSAANMAEVFRDKCELALERELNFVVEQLRKNEPLLYRLSGYLKDDSLVALLDGRMNATVEQNDEALSIEKNKTKQMTKVLRRAWKKWEHIEGSHAFLISLLRAA